MYLRVYVFLFIPLLQSSEFFPHLVYGFEFVVSSFDRLGSEIKKELSGIVDKV